MHIVQQLRPYQPPASTLTTSIVLTTYPLPSSHHQSIFTTFSYYNCTHRTPLAIASLFPNLHQFHNPNNTCLDDAWPCKTFPDWNRCLKICHRCSTYSTRLERWSTPGIIYFKNPFSYWYQLWKLVSEMVKYLKNVYSDLLVLAEDPPASDVI